MSVQKTTFLFFILFAYAPLLAENTPLSPFTNQNPFTGTPKIQFEEPLHNFGKIVQGEPVHHKFGFTNTGTGDLIIYKAKGSCGCTAAAVSTGPFKPGEQSYIEVSYDSRGKFGHVYKDVKVESNDPDSPTTLIIEGVSMQGNHPPMTSGKTLFKGSCAECHFAPAKGKSGKELYQAVCSMCHDPSNENKLMAADRFAMSERSFKSLINSTSHGVPGTSMPGFLSRHGGPLSKKQIKSLAEYLRSLNKED